MLNIPVFWKLIFYLWKLWNIPSWLLTGDLLWALCFGIISLGEFVCYTFASFFCLRTWYKEANSQRKPQLAAISPLMSLPSLPKWRDRDMFNVFLYMHANTSFSYAQWPMHHKWCFFKHSLKCPSEGSDYYPNHCFMASACWRPVRLTYCNEFNGIRGTGGES